jgi:large subunit ribosomal protein L6
MSRIGKKPIELAGAKVKLEGGVLYFEGAKGKLELSIPAEVRVEIEDKKIIVHPGAHMSGRKMRAFHGLYRALIQNNVTGVNKGYEKRLKLNGVGFRAKVEGRELVLNLGFSHPVRHPIPEGIEVKTEEKDTLVILNAIDKQRIGQTAAEIRGYYPPEPYKGKGIKYTEEIIRRKKGKRIA